MSSCDSCLHEIDEHASKTIRVSAPGVKPEVDNIVYGKCLHDACPCPYAYSEEVSNEEVS